MIGRTVQLSPSDVATVKEWFEAALLASPTGSAMPGMELARQLGFIEKGKDEATNQGSVIGV
jgi:hypothetical protein